MKKFKVLTGNGNQTPAVCMFGVVPLFIPPDAFLQWVWINLLYVACFLARTSKLRVKTLVWMQVHGLFPAPHAASTPSSSAVMRASSLRGTGRDLAEYFLRCACLIGAFLDGIVRHDNGAGRAGFMCFLKAVKTVPRSLSCGRGPFLGGNLWKSEVQIVGPVSLELALLVCGLGRVQYQFRIRTTRRLRWTQVQLVFSCFDSTAKRSQWYIYLRFLSLLLVSGEFGVQLTQPSFGWR